MKRWGPMASSNRHVWYISLFGKVTRSASARVVARAKVVAVGKNGLRSDAGQLTLIGACKFPILLYQNL